MDNTYILKRLYRDYTRKFVNKILISVFFSLLVAGSTSAIAYLLDPAIKKILLEKDKTLISGIAIFQTKNDKEQFLNEWSSKINSYSVDLDENN